MASTEGPITVYGASWCPDCRRAKQFLKERGVAFSDVNIDEDPDAEELVMKVYPSTNELQIWGNIKQAPSTVSIFVFSTSRGIARSFYI